MSRSKYPPFERVTAGRLAVGDRVLVRDRGSDAQWVEPPTFANGARVGGVELTTGVHEVVKITSELRQAHRRASRYYDVTVLVTGIGEQTVNCSSVQRWNRVLS